jgi:hypothetical protein
MSSMVRARAHSYMHSSMAHACMHTYLHVEIHGQTDMHKYMNAQSGMVPVINMMRREYAHTTLAHTGTHSQAHRDVARVHLPHVPRMLRAASSSIRIYPHTYICYKNPRGSLPWATSLLNALCSLCMHTCTYAQVRWHLHG